ncbi:MAG: Ig-like domain-containing protein [Capsulimonadales bacterium]|nr:Ig-like domain-containing protein [Capsulimonadales bacterium]
MMPVMLPGQPATLAALTALCLGVVSAAMAQTSNVDPNAPLLPVPENPGKFLPVPPDRVESHRIRIVNQRDGAIQISLDRGETWQLIGRVRRPARTAVEGYIAAQYAPPATVAAVAVHGLRICIGGRDRYVRAPLVIGIEPQEFGTQNAREGKTPNKGFGGYVAGTAGIFTDIPAGTALFRDLSPFVGNPIYLESPTRRLYAIPEDFLPRGEGEAFVIPVLAPKNPVTSVVFENKAGGEVNATFADGTTRKITHVIKPVLGTGRFDGTAYTGVGQVNTSHTGVLTIGTAPIDPTRREGTGREQRGGFQISPVWHNRRTDEFGADVIMTVGTPGTRKKELEGKAPLFSGFIRPDDAENAFAEVSIDGGPWEPMPTVIGARLGAFKAAGLERLWSEQGHTRKARFGVTAIRLNLTPPRPERIRLCAERAAQAHSARRLMAARAGEIPLVKGVITVNAAPTDRSKVAFVRLSVNGMPRGMTNVAPFNLSWDTTRVPDGEYQLEAQAMDATGSVLAAKRTSVYVLNHPSEKPEARRSANVDGTADGRK